MSQPIDIERLLQDEQARGSQPKRFAPLAATEHTFESLGEDSYRMSIPLWSVMIEVSRLRREYHNLRGELSVSCGLPGARTVEGILSAAEFNFSDADARNRRARLLDTAACTRGAIDWAIVLEEFCLRVIRAERAGDPAVMLGKPDLNYRRDLWYNIDGLSLLQKHPTIVFGGPSSCKSYIAAHALGKLSQQGKNVLYIDWELSREDHEFRLNELFPDGAPPVAYMRCYRSLGEEVERIVREVKEKKLDYIAFDSAGYACGGAPESAEVALAYWRYVRQIGVGGLHLAHNPKNDVNGKVNDKEPFGSRFWTAGARQIWFAGVDDTTENPKIIALFCRRTSLDRRSPPVAYRLHWTEYGTCEFTRTSIMESQELSEKMSMRDRIYQVLTLGAKTVPQIAEELDIEPDTVRKTVNRCVSKGKTFIMLDGDGPNRRVGLLSQDKLSRSVPGQSRRTTGQDTTPP